MTAHLGIHGRLFRALTLAGLVAVAACGASSSPRINVLGVQQTNSAPRQTLTVFVEVVNPTAQNLQLSRLEYQVRADRWFDTKGEVSLSRDVGAQSSAVVEIQVPVKSGGAADDAKIPYTLIGRLFAREDAGERSWQVSVKGALGAMAGGQGAPLRVTVVE
ncbi:MAG TPA: hypothetical protein VMZ28_02175 [Kofleriaceae bacterium]|nr:hypothetical protein [Kofleriaceae bacterium]